MDHLHHSSRIEVHHRLRNDSFHYIDNPRYRRCEDTCAERKEEQAKRLVTGCLFSFFLLSTHFIVVIISSAGSHASLSWRNEGLPLVTLFVFSTPGVTVEQTSNWVSCWNEEKVWVIDSLLKGYVRILCSSMLTVSISSMWVKLSSMKVKRKDDKSQAKRCRGLKKTKQTHPSSPAGTLILVKSPTAVNWTKVLVLTNWAAVKVP